MFGLLIVAALLLWLVAAFVLLFSLAAMAKYADLEASAPVPPALAEAERIALYSAADTLEVEAIG